MYNHSHFMGYHKVIPSLYDGFSVKTNVSDTTTHTVFDEHKEELITFTESPDSNTSILALQDAAVYFILLMTAQQRMEDVEAVIGKVLDQRVHIVCSYKTGRVMVIGSYLTLLAYHDIDKDIVPNYAFTLDGIKDERSTAITQALCSAAYKGQVISKSKNEAKLHLQQLLIAMSSHIYTSIPYDIDKLDIGFGVKKDGFYVKSNGLDVAKFNYKPLGVISEPLPPMLHKTMHHVFNGTFPTTADIDLLFKQIVSNYGLVDECIFVFLNTSAQKNPGYYITTSTGRPLASYNIAPRTFLSRLFKAKTYPKV